MREISAPGVSMEDAVVKGDVALEIGNDGTPGSLRLELALSSLAGVLNETAIPPRDLTFGLETKMEGTALRLERCELRESREGAVRSLLSADGTVSLEPLGAQIAWRIAPLSADLMNLGAQIAAFAQARIQAAKPLRATMAKPCRPEPSPPATVKSRRSCSYASTSVDAEHALVSAGALSVVFFSSPPRRARSSEDADADPVALGHARPARRRPDLIPWPELPG